MQKFAARTLAGLTALATSMVGLQIPMTPATAAPSSVTVFADFPSTITSDDSVPSVGYVSSPPTAGSDWSTEPDCGVYDTTDIAFSDPLTGAQPAGIYTTHCVGGSSVIYNPTAYVNGTLTVVAASASTRVMVGPDADVYATAVDSAGITYVGGQFTLWGAQTGGGASVAIADAAVQRTMSAVDGPVLATVADGSGGFYIGGDFGSVGGVERLRVAHVLTDGSVDPGWNPNADGIVRAIALSGSLVFLGGDFTTIGGDPRNHAAAVRNDGALDAWDPDANGAVLALTVSASTVYLGGDFTQVDGFPRNHAAAVDTNGTLTGWDPDADYVVRALTATASTVYVGGDFTQVDGFPRNHAAAVDINGTLEAWDPDADGAVRALAVSGSSVYLGGDFTQVDGSSRNHAAAVETGGTLTTWDPNTAGPVHALGAGPASVYLGGEFTIVAGEARKNAAALDPGGQLTSWSPDVSDSVTTIAVAGSTVYIGGNFRTVDSIPRNRLAAVGTDGMLTSWDPDANDEVVDLVVDDSTAYIAGAFTSMGSAPRHFAAAVSRDDTGTVTAWDPQPNNSVYALAESDGVVYMGGAFTQLASDTRNHAGAVSADGTLLPWDPDLSAEAFTLAVSGSTAYIGGAFATAHGEPRNSAAAVGTDDEATLMPWDPNPDGHIFAMSVSGSAVYMGGAFTTMGPDNRNHLAAVTADGSGTLTPWNPDVNQSVYTIAIANTRAYYGGTFTTAGGFFARTFSSSPAVVTVIPDSPAAISSQVSVPTIEWASKPVTGAGAWVTQPTCAVYAPSDTAYATALTGPQLPGQYVTHCIGGTTVDGNDLLAADGSLTVTSSVNVTVTADSPTAIAYATPLPAIGYTTVPGTVESDWTAEPSCAVYASDDSVFTTPLTGMPDAGTYSTHCVGGTSSGYTPTSYANGTLTISPAASTTRVTCPSSVAYTGTAVTPCAVIVTGAGGLFQTPPPTYANNTSIGTNSASASYSFAGDANHTGSSDRATFSITPVEAIAYAVPDAQTIAFGSAVPRYTLTYHVGSPTGPLLDIRPTTATTCTSGYRSRMPVVDSPQTIRCVGGSLPGYTLDTSSISLLMIGKAPSTTVLSCPAAVPHTGLPLRPCAARVRGAGGLSEPVAVDYQSNTDVGLAQAAATFDGDANHLGSSDAVTFEVTRDVPSLRYTGTRLIITPRPMLLRSSRVSAGCTGHVRYVLNRNPITGAKRRHVLTGTSVATTGWREGAYTLTVVSSARSGCDAAATKVAVSVSRPLTARSAAGAGWYANDTTFGFVVRTGTKTVGQVNWTARKAWRYRGDLRDFTKTGQRGTATGIGTLSRWDPRRNAGRGGWRPIDARTAATITFRATTRGTSRPGRFGIVFALPNSGHQLTPGPGTSVSTGMRTLSGGAIKVGHA